MLDQDRLDRILAKQESVRLAIPGGRLRHDPQGTAAPDPARRPVAGLLPLTFLAVTGSPTPLQKEIAAVLYAGRDTVLSAGRDSVLTGLAALRRHGLKVPATAEISVLIPASQASQGRRSHAFVTVRPTLRMPAPVCYRGVVQYALPERALADAARELHSFRQVRALVADAVQQRRCRLDRLQAELEHGPRRGSMWLRQSLAEVAAASGRVLKGTLVICSAAAGCPRRCSTPASMRARPSSRW